MNSLTTPPQQSSNRTVQELFLLPEMSSELLKQHIKQNRIIDRIEEQNLVPLFVYTDVGAMEIRCKQNKYAKYPVAMLPNECFDKEKADLPLFGGFLYRNGRRNKELATEAIVTLDVDDELNAKRLEAAFEEADDPRFFKSYSASGKCKVHAVVRLVDDSGKRRYFDPRRAAKGLCLLLGYDYAKVDPQGVLKAFVTRSFADSLDATSKKPVQTIGYDELDRLVRVSRDKGEERSKRLSPSYFRPGCELQSLADAVVMSSAVGKRAKPAAAKVLGALMTATPNEDGLRFLALEGVEGLKRTQVAVALNNLIKVGVITVVEHAVAKRKCRRFRVNVPVPIQNQGTCTEPLETLNNYASSLAKSGVAVAGNYNEAEKKIVGLAVSLNLQEDDVLATLLAHWTGWLRADRVKRLGSTFSGLLKRDSTKWDSVGVSAPFVENTPENRLEALQAI